MVVRRKIVYLLKILLAEGYIFKTARQRLASDVVQHLKEI